MVESGDEIVPPVTTPAGQLALSIVSFFIPKTLKTGHTRFF